MADDDHAVKGVVLINRDTCSSAGAEYRLGREASGEFHESLAPPTADKMHHGNTVVFRTRTAAQPTMFPDVPWAVEVAKDYADLGGQVVVSKD